MPSLASFRLICLALLLALSGAALGQDWIYTARPGDNLWNLSKAYLSEGVRYTRRLQRLNGIEEPTRIPPGTKIRMPVRWLKVQPVPAEIVYLRGEVQVLAAGSSAAGPASLGTRLLAGASLLTGAASSARIRFADGSTLTVLEGSEVVMDELSAYERTGMVDTRMRLRKGRVESSVEEFDGPGSRFEINTPAAVAAVRGTRYRVASDAASEKALTEVLDGNVGFGTERAVQEVPAGFGTVAEVGQPPAPPIPLLPAPDLSSLPARLREITIGLAWPAVAGARAYRVQLFADAALEQLLEDRLTPEPGLLLPAPPDARYVLRVRAIDASGLEGLDAVRPIEVDARPIPPPLLQPADGSQTHDKPPTFWWSTPQGISRFHLQVAADAGFDSLLLDLPATEEVRHTLPALPPPGEYHWRVASVVPGEEGPYGETRRFRVLAVPDAVAADAPGVDDKTLTFSWGPAAHAAEYRFQLASDERFDELLIDESLTQTRYTLDTPSAGTYYFRVQAVSAEGVSGPPGTPNRFAIEGSYPWPAFLLFLAPLLLLL